MGESVADGKQGISAGRIIRAMLCNCSGPGDSFYDREPVSSASAVLSVSALM